MGTAAEHEATDPRAPGDLDLVRIFVNTLDVEHGHDVIGTREQLKAWLVERGLTEADTAVRPKDLTNLLEFREALRALLIANHDDTPPPADAVATLERLGDRARLAIGFDAEGSPHLLPTEKGVCGFEGRLLAAIVEARIAGTWDRLKACGCSTCLWVFYDESKNRSRSWCSMEVCGNREKARRYRARARR